MVARRHPPACASAQLPAVRDTAIRLCGHRDPEPVVQLGRRFVAHGFVVTALSQQLTNTDATEPTCGSRLAAMRRSMPRRYAAPDASSARLAWLAWLAWPAVN